MQNSEQKIIYTRLNKITTGMLLHAYCKWFYHFAVYHNLNFIKLININLGADSNRGWKEGDDKGKKINIEIERNWS